MPDYGDCSYSKPMSRACCLQYPTKCLIFSVFLYVTQSLEQIFNIIYEMIILGLQNKRFVSNAGVSHAHYCPTSAAVVFTTNLKRHKYLYVFYCVFNTIIIRYGNATLFRYVVFHNITECRQTSFMSFIQHIPWRFGIWTILLLGIIM